MFQRQTLTLLLATLLIASVAVPASAAVEEGSNSFEIYAGIYFPDGDLFDENATYGVRLGRAFTPRWGGEISAGYFSDDNTIGPVENDLDILMVDFNLLFFANPDSRAVFTVSGGIGWADQDFDAVNKGAGTSVSSDSDSFTANAGIGGRFALGSSERAFMRVDGKVRYFEDRDDDDIDWEATLAFGWIWGN